jgi:hypothetical protein
MRMDKPTAVIDKCLLQPICALEDKTRSRFLRFLMEHFTIYATPMLIEETAANYYRPTRKTPKDLAAKMLGAILRFRLMEHPLELVYQEVILRRVISTGFDLNPTMAGKYRRWMTDPDAYLAELEQLFLRRYQGKRKKLDDRKQFQGPFKDPANPDALNFPDDAAFVRYGKGFLEAMFTEPRSRATRFFGYVCRRVNEWHPEASPQTVRAFSALALADLGRIPFTHDLLLACLLYLSAPVARIGPEQARKSTPPVLPDDQINNEEDEEYVTSAVLCDYLFTCDRGMHRMAGLLNPACLFKHAGCKQRQAVLIPPTDVGRIEDLLGRFA